MVGYRLRTSYDSTSTSGSDRTRKREKTKGEGRANRVSSQRGIPAGFC